jgi:hypothetical protein
MTEDILAPVRAAVAFADSVNPLAKEVHTAAGQLRLDSEIPDLPPWDAQDYASSITGSGADKLADSGVAPLVAAARGYSRLDDSNIADELKRMKVRLNSTQGRRLKNSIESPGRDGMLMPWYSAADIHIASRNSEVANPFTYQIRPSHPELNDKGKPIKYEFLAKLGTPLDIHPATPVDWIDTTPAVMFAEGMLKGDSALSGYLHAQGIPSEELKGEGIEDPLAHLRSIMEAIPHEDRVLIISIAGIYNTPQNPVDWREIDLRGREGWIALDADLTENRFVYQAALELKRRLEEKSKMTQVLFMNPKVVSGEQGELAKAGVDDYLAKAGTWQGLLRELTKYLPAPPKSSDDEQPGNWRIHKDGQSTEECIAIADGPGGQISRYEWKRVVDLGGYIMSLEARRQPTDQEIRTGLFNPNVAVHDIDESIVEIMVEWKTGGRDVKAVVTGPKSILNYAPHEWDRKGAIIPDDLLLHRSWPPERATGHKWLSALKANRAGETARKTRWMRMGWVPVEQGDPVFLIGDQVIGDNEVSASAVAGIDEGNLSVAGHFGVGEDIEGDWGDPAYHERVRQDFRDVMKTYVQDEPWTEPSTAAFVLAVALRPGIPLRPRTTAFIWGPKGKGKSWTAQAIMYFWARRRTDWQDRLPGGAKDTPAFLETAVSKAPIWVVDDLAPSISKKQSEQETAKLEDLTRAIFNNAAKGRMNVDMTAKKVNKPIAQLIITAENELTTPSAKERLISVFIGNGKLNPEKAPTDAVNTLSSERGVQARFTAHFIKYIRHTAVNYAGGWEGFMESIERDRRDQQDAARHIMRRHEASNNSLERATSLAADLLLTFSVLEDMANALEMDWDFREQFQTGVGLGQHLVELVHNAHAANQNGSPGRAVVRALSAVLASGRAHVVSAEDPARPPLEATGEGESLMNHRLGWVPGGSAGEMRPAGDSIGLVVTKDDRKIILFDVETAFSTAQHYYPQLIQHGQGSASAWASVWDEGLAPDNVARRETKLGTYANTTRIRIGDKTRGPRVSGVPIDVDTILNGSLSLDDFSNDDSNF